MTALRSLDLTGAFQPPLSTTSDMPTVGEPKQEKWQGAVSEAELKSGSSRAPQNAGAKTDDNVSTETTRDETPPRREIDQARSREAEARAQAIDERLSKALAALEKTETRTDSEVKNTQADPRPKRRDFDDPDSFEDELVKWSAKTAAKLTQAEIEKQQKERETKTREQQFQSEHKKRLDAWSSAKNKAIEKYPDFVEVAESPHLTITPAMAIAILEENLDGGNGYEISYYLGHHPEEAEKISQLKSQNAIERAIGRLAARLALGEPLKTRRSRPGAIKNPTAEESMEEYARRRNAEIRAKNR